MSVTVTQLGGHTGSYAGDCAIVEVDDKSGKHIVIIDTGDSVIWKDVSLAKYVRSLKTFKNAKVTLVTTHFHRDHFNPDVVAQFKSGEIDLHVYSNAAAKSVKFPGLGNGVKVMSLDKGETKVDLGSSAKLTYYVPPTGLHFDDQNDLSMAVRVGCDDFSYLSFGDMTKDAYLRLAKHLGGHLASATVTKYPHHGNFPNNYIDYYNRNLFGTAVLISGNSLSRVTETITALLNRNVGAVYCLAGTDDAKTAFRDCWKAPNRPVYLSEGAVVKASGVSVIDHNATYLTVIEKSMGRRSKQTDSWERVNEQWSDSVEMKFD